MPDTTGAIPPTVFYLSDFGLADEFVGVVHSVIHRLAPGATVVDLTHEVRPFDVRDGAQTLLRAVPHLGPGVVLAVVDPGVGTSRLGIAVEAADGRWFVAPDNGLVVPIAEQLGGIERVLELRRPSGNAVTFDGRDVFGPAAAALARGDDPATVGDPLDPASLVRLPEPVVMRWGSEGRSGLRAEVTWVDRFGNVQLASPASDGPTDVGVSVEVRVGSRAAAGARDGHGTDAANGQAAGDGPGAHAGATHLARRVRAFGDLAPGELGLLVDANGHLALALCQGSAAQVTGAEEGALAELAW